MPRGTFIIDMRAQRTGPQPQQTSLRKGTSNGDVKVGEVEGQKQNQTKKCWIKKKRKFY